MIVSLSDRILGTLPSPEMLHAGREFTLDDGSMLTVRVMGRLVQVWHDDRPLWEVSPRPKAIVSDKVTRRIMLICANLALVIGIISLCIGSDFYDAFCGPGAIFCLPSSHPPPPITVIFALGFGLFSLIAFLVGVRHSIAKRAWGWIAFGFPLSPLLAILLWGLLHFDFSFLVQVFWVFLPILFFLPIVVGLLFPVVCLIYAQSLK